MFESIAILLLAVCAAVSGLHTRKLTRRLCENQEQQVLLATENARLKSALPDTSIFDALPVRISRFDREERVIYANKYSGMVHGGGSVDLVGKTIREVRGEASYLSIKPYIERVLSGEPVRYEHSLTSSGLVRYFQQDYVPEFKEDGKVCGFISISFEITDRHLNEERLFYQSRHDMLTGLANRLVFEERLPLAIASSQSSGLPLALAFIDVDHFKRINDQYGHAAGDHALRTLAGRIRALVRASDTVARLAGDEFVVILEGLHQPLEATAIVQNLLRAMDEPMELAGARVRVSVSVGVAYCLGTTFGPEALLARADKALYAAKAACRNTMRSNMQLTEAG